MLHKCVLLFGVLALVACAPASTRLSRDAYSTQEVVRNFVPDRGEGGNYKLGEYVRFSFSLTQPGFVTVISADNDGIYELERNQPLGAGPHNLPLKTDVNAKGESAAYRISPPTGIQRVILLYTDVPGPGKTDVKFEAKFEKTRDSATNSFELRTQTPRLAKSQRQLENAVKTFLQRSNARVRDLQELSINVETK
jgi:hypothetical protein